MMKCKCGADMNHQSQGVYFCTKGDMFLVVIVRTERNHEQMGTNMTAQHQWYKKYGRVEKIYETTIKDADGSRLLRQP